MPETPEASLNTPPDSGLDGVAALLAAQIDACNEAAARCFEISKDKDSYYLESRLDALKVATRLIQASANAASAIKRIRGSEFHQHVTVSSAP
ncbi:MAG TPA: hypothetical protein VLC29_06030 [Rhizomicrobium sp.]|nr:hypothetical protein [Rhizomicrobium sp.]